MPPFRFLFCIIFFVIPSIALPQVAEFDSTGLKLIREIEQYCRGSLEMDLPNDYYKKWADSNKPNYYVYIAEKDSIKSISALPYRSFGRNKEQAMKSKSFYDSLGFHTLLYKTYGTAATQLSKHLLAYQKVSIAFIAFHEATHLYLRSDGKRIPYVLEEASCDLMGNYGSLLFSDQSDLLSKREAEEQIQQIEQLAVGINLCIAAKNETEREKGYSALRKQIQRLDSSKNRFKAERYNYELNNAYLVRNKSYTYHYFKLKQLYQLKNSLREFLLFMRALPRDEASSLLIIDNEILRLTKKSGQ